MGIGSVIRKKSKKSDLWKEFSLWFYNQPCFYCEEEMNEDGHSRKGRTADHIIPAKYGGGLHRKNLLPCCNECNNIRGNMDFITYGIIHILSKSLNVDVEQSVKQYDTQIKIISR